MEKLPFIYNNPLFLRVANLPTNLKNILAYFSLLPTFWLSKIAYSTTATAACGSKYFSIFSEYDYG